jgi:hypothetical protein
MATVHITVSSDLSTLGSDATEADLETYTTNLARLVAGEFGCEVEVGTDSISRTIARCSDDNLREAVAEWVRDIESSDDWAAMLEAPGEEETEHPASEYTVDSYTATWDAAMNSRPTLRAGDTVLTREDCDAREWDAFRRCLREDGVALQFDGHDEDTGLDTYDVVAADGSKAAGEIY